MANFRDVRNIIVPKEKFPQVKKIWYQCMERYNVKNTFIWRSPFGYLRWIEIGLNPPYRYAKAQYKFWERLHKKCLTEINATYILKDGSKVPSYLTFFSSEVDQLESKKKDSIF